MSSLNGKTAVVVGGSRNTGKAIALALDRCGARVLVAARREASLEQLRKAAPSIETLALDATTPEAPGALFKRVTPDILVLALGAPRPGKPFFELDWDEFSETWNTDVRASFNFCREAMRRPLPRGSLVVQISSGAGIGGSPISGGYAGAKRMQMLLANYAQRESERLGAGLRFLTVVPMRPMFDTDEGRDAAANYARYLGISAAAFMEGMEDAQSTQDVARAVVQLAENPPAGPANNYIVTKASVEAMN
jgi:NAD(P)-dependent dehydrogenase (short-subunit alcohol dehydrogenase family)